MVKGNKTQFVLKLKVILLLYRHPPQVFIDALEKVTEGDLKTMVKNMIKTPVSIASVGNVAYVPRYSEVQRKFA